MLPYAFGRARLIPLFSSAVVLRSNRLSLSIAGTAAVALTSLPFGITPVNAARVSQESTASIGVVETSSNAQQFNLKTQGASTVLVAKCGGPLGGVCFSIPQAFLDKIQPLLEFLQQFRKN